MVMYRLAPTPSPSTLQVTMLGNHTSSRPIPRTARHARSAGTRSFLAMEIVYCIVTPIEGLARLLLTANGAGAQLRAPISYQLFPVRADAHRTTWRAWS